MLAINNTTEVLTPFNGDDVIISVKRHQYLSSCVTVNNSSVLVNRQQYIISLTVIKTSVLANHKNPSCLLSMIYTSVHVDRQHYPVLSHRQQYITFVNQYIISVSRHQYLRFVSPSTIYQLRSLSSIPQCWFAIDHLR